MRETTDEQFRRHLVGGCESRPMTNRGANKAAFERVRKRDGRLVPFDAERITDALFRAAREAGWPPRYSPGARSSP